jgi:hypothetical protein
MRDAARRGPRVGDSELFVTLLVETLRRLPRADAVASDPVCFAARQLIQLE